MYGTLLGKPVTGSIELPEAIPAPSLEGYKLDEIVMEATEFTSVCPVTGQPDFGRVVITYVPREKILESKSLKLYLQKFRNRGIFCEGLAVEILRDLDKVLEPVTLSVVVYQNPRGGIGIRASAVR